MRKRSLGDHYLDDIHAYRINRDTFSIYIGGDPTLMGNEGAEPGVDFNMADRFELNLDVLSSIDKHRPIVVNMSSCGGFWEEGMKMFSAILACPNPITVVATKHARSMTSLIPLAADKFIIRPPATYMFHRGTYVIEALDEEVETEDNERRKAVEMMLRIYVARLREQGKFKTHSEARIKNMLLQSMREKINVHLTADEAVAWGFADAIYLGWNLEEKEEYRATKVNIDRRHAMMEVLRKPITLKFEIS
jgi:ATP-dependent protease ClpP protease subunit